MSAGARGRKLPAWPLLLALAAGCDVGTVAVEPDLPRPAAGRGRPVDGDPLRSGILSG